MKSTQIVYLLLLTSCALDIAALLLMVATGNINIVSLILISVKLLLVTTTLHKMRNTEISITPARSFILGIVTAYLLLFFNYTFLGDILINITVLPLMVVTIMGVHFHHFILSLGLMPLGILLVLKNHKGLGYFIIGFALIILTDDFIDILHFIETGALRIK